MAALPSPCDIFIAKTKAASARALETTRRCPKMAGEINDPLNGNDICYMAWFLTSECINSFLPFLSFLISSGGVHSPHLRNLRDFATLIIIPFLYLSKLLSIRFACVSCPASSWITVTSVMQIGHIA